MKALEEKEKLSLQDILLSGFFRLIAKTIKVFLNLAFVIRRVLDFRRRKILKDFDKFFSQTNKQDFVVIYAKSRKDENISTLANSIILILNEEKYRECEFVEDNLLRISSNLFFKYYEELKPFLSTQKGSLLILSPDINSAQLLVDLNAMKYMTTASFSKHESNIAKFVMRNSIKNNSIKEEI
jgi:hypothetical protein